MRSFIDEMLIDLISNAQCVVLDAQRGDLLHLLTSVDLSEWVIRRIDDDYLGLVGERCL